MNAHRRNARGHSGLTVWIATLALGACGDNCPLTPKPKPPPLLQDTQGCGDITVGGATNRYRVVPEETGLFIMVPINNGKPGCTFFHSHAIKSLATRYEFALDRDNANTGTFTA